MHAVFELRTLGVPRLFAPGGRELRVRTSKHLALLVYLAVEPTHTARREYLIELLWPRVSLPRGRQSLATAISALRGRLGRDLIETGGDKVRLCADRFRLDLERLEAGDVVGDEHTPRLEVQGFLEGFDVPDAPEFGMWRDRQRARLLPAVERALIVLADHARRTADLTQLARIADRLLELDELSEAGIRARMEAHALAGDRITAVRIFDEWAARLRSELGAKPSPLLEGMAMRLRLRGLERSRDSAPPPVRTEHWAHRPFVGRAREYRILYELWERIGSGEPRHCLILGDSGVGKTTLADRLATAVAFEGAHVARVRCYELERGIPYATIGGVVEVLVDRPGAVATNPQSLAELGRVVPAVHQRFTNLPLTVEMQGEAARIRFAEAVLDLLLALMDESPVLLVVDDFPLADDASLAVLHLLMRRLADRPFMVVLTSRPELQQDAPNAQRIRNGVGYLGMQVLDLEPMHRQDMEALLDLLIREGHPRPGPSERRILLRAAAGYPLALELLFQDWLARGATSVGFSLDAMTPEMVERPDRFYEVVAEGLIQSLDSATRMTLHLAAVLDRRLNDLELYRLVDQTPAQTMVCLARLVDIRALRDRGAGLEFINPGMRTQAYLGIPTPLRRMLHAGVADRLLELEARGHKIPGLEIAWHSIRSGRTEQVGPYLVRGAREAIDDGAPHEAELALVSGMNLLHDDLREQGHLLLAEALQELGRWQDSARHLTSVPRPRAQDLALKTELLVIRAQVRTAELVRTADLGDTDLLKIARDMEALARTHDVPPLRVLAIEIAAYACDHLRHLDLSRTLREAADTIPLEPLEPGDKVRLLLSKARLAYFERENSSAEAFLKQAERVAEGAGMRSSLLAQTIAGYGVISVAKGDYASAIPHFSRQFEIARRLDDDYLAARTAANLALCWARLGDLERQHEWATRCLSFKPSRTYNVDQVLGLGLLGLAQGLMGQRVEARRTARELVTRSLSHHPLWLGQTVILNAADIYWIAGERERALALSTRGTTAEYSTPRSREIAGSFARWCAVAAVTRGRPLPSDHLTTLLQLLAARERIDAGDAVQVMSALHLVGRLDPDLIPELKARIESLPPGLVDLLWKYGLRPLPA